MTANLSYIISTRNRLPFLKITLGKLISELQPDEEIVVVDGDSTDGAKEFLQQLFNEGKIHQFISEPDKNQAHGWNKALLMAKGTIIKKIIDDDVFCYESIRNCKSFMLQNKDVDVVISNDLSSSLFSPDKIDKNSRVTQYQAWRSGLVDSCTFGDVHLLIRRTSLAYIGLYDTSYINMDWEYALRITYLKAKVVYYTGYNALTVAHSQTATSLRDKQRIKEEGDKGRLLYNYAGDNTEITYWSKIKIFIGNIIYRENQGDQQAKEVGSLENISTVYDHFYRSISKINKGTKAAFLDQ